MEYLLMSIAFTIPLFAILVIAYWVDCYYNGGQ